MAGSAWKTNLISDPNDRRTLFAARQVQGGAGQIERIRQNTDGTYSWVETQFPWSGAAVVANSGHAYNLGRHEPSIGMAPDGHIFYSGLGYNAQLMLARTGVVGDISAWDDWRNNPSAPDHGLIGTHPTYGARFHQAFPRFSRIHGNLFLTQRILVVGDSVPPGSVGGDFGFGLYRLDDGVWNSLGGPHSGSASPVMVHYTTGATNTGYQQGVVHLYPSGIDNAMHIAWWCYANDDLIGNPSELHYAFSPDMGDSWQTVSGTVLGTQPSELPITASDAGTPPAGTLVLRDTVNKFREQSLTISERPDGSPVIGYGRANDNIARRVVWNPTTEVWMQQSSPASGTASSRQLVTSDDTLIILSTNGAFYSSTYPWTEPMSFTPGSSTQMQRQDDCSIDIDYFWESNVIRYAIVNMQSDGGPDNNMTFAEVDLGIPARDVPTPIPDPVPAGTHSQMGWAPRALPGGFL